MTEYLMIPVYQDSPCLLLQIEPLIAAVCVVEDSFPDTNKGKGHVVGARHG